MRREPDLGGLPGPEVSVIVPTHRRSDLVRRAVASVLAQSFDSLEVVVVVDGSDPKTEAWLAEHPDPRLRFVVAASPVGGSGARNLGLAESRGEWIALLDDDDEWLPDKLAVQLPRMRNTGTSVIGYSQVIRRSARGDEVAPRRGPAADEPLGDYLFVRRALLSGSGRVQTSTVIAHRSLFDQVRFDPTVPRFQDTEWLLRAAEAGGRLMFIRQPLAVWHVEDGRPSITASYADNWRYAMSWIEERRHLVSREAYAAFVLDRAASAAFGRPESPGLRFFWRAAISDGRPTPMTTVVFLAKWLVPPGQRAWLRRMVTGIRRGTSQNTGPRT